MTRQLTDKERSAIQDVVDGISIISIRSKCSTLRPYPLFAHQRHLAVLQVATAPSGQQYCIVDTPND